ncbi:hypothetical protein BV22DRAFT_1047706 [Leucogyrophana mollusca]|uniref:Uncharacterized protein n=1 Tax=Leucogyrophana mollusca TaxID=85980 RepID=A0ACB8BF31_9AGAM|nr:hypothetical protein BV22DRAFT_1047706 [Leucogyrophana mollusca]
MSSQSTIRLPHRSELDPSWQGSQVIDLSNPPPDDESTIRFPVVEGVTGRVMRLPGYSFYTLEFLKSDDTRVRDAPQLQVFDVKGSNPVLISTSRGHTNTTQFYYISPERTYAVRYDGIHKKHYPFPVLSPLARLVLNVVH